MTYVVGGLPPSREASADHRSLGGGGQALLSFNDDGSIASFESDDRYRSNGKNHERATWTTPVSRYGDVDGVKVPLVADVRWKSSTYDFCYARFEVTGIAFNVAAEHQAR